MCGCECFNSDYVALRFFVVLGAILVLYLGFRAFSYLNWKKLIEKVMNGKGTPIYRDEVLISSELNTDMKLVQQIANRNYSILRINMEPLRIVFGSQKIFERYAIIYSLERSKVSEEKMQLTLYNNKFDLHYNMNYTHKGSKELFQTVKKNIFTA